MMATLTNLRFIPERVILRTVASLLYHKLCLLFFRYLKILLVIVFILTIFFISSYLLRDLHEKSFRALGTMRQGRTMKCSLRPSKSVEKEECGCFDHRSDDYVSIVQ